MDSEIFNHCMYRSYTEPSEHFIQQLTRRQDNEIFPDNNGFSSPSITPQLIESYALPVCPQPQLLSSFLNDRHFLQTTLSPFPQTLLPTPVDLNEFITNDPKRPTQKDFSNLSLINYEINEFAIDDNLIPDILNSSAIKTEFIEIKQKENEVNNTNKEVTHTKQLKEISIGVPCKSKHCQLKNKLQCHQLSNKDRSTIFKKFWSEMSWDQRRIFVVNNVNEFQRQIKIDKSAYTKRKYFEFTLVKKRQKLKVCKKMFLNTLKLKPDLVFSWIRNSQFGIIPKRKILNSIKEKLKDTKEEAFNAQCKHFIEEQNLDENDIDEKSLMCDGRQSPFNSCNTVSKCEESCDPLQAGGVLIDENSSTEEIAKLFKQRDISKKTQPPHMGLRCKSKRCKKCLKVTENHRSYIFNKFWNEMNWKQRKEFVLSNVVKRAPQRTTKPEGTSMRKYTYEYFLPFGDLKIQICCILFVRTLGIHLNMVKRWLKKGPDQVEEIQVEKIQENPETLLEIKQKKKGEMNWADLSRELRNKGQAYIGVSIDGEQTVRPARKIKERCAGLMCDRTEKRKCSEITEEMRIDLFNRFWIAMDWDERKIFVYSHIVEESVHRRRNSSKQKRSKSKIKENFDTQTDLNRRSSTFRYFLYKNDEKVQVCQKMFLNTLGLGSHMVHSWMKKSEFGVFIKRKKRLDQRTADFDICEADDDDEPLSKLKQKF